MDAEICKNFLLVKTKFPDQLDSEGKYYFNDDGHFKQYCSNQNCVNELEKISAGCLYLFDTFFKDSSVFESVAKSNINIVDYIIIWLSYMLSLKENNDKNSLSFFYTTYINNEKYKNPIDGVEVYSNYKDITDEKHDLTNEDMDKNIIANLYDAFNKLCNMYTEFNENSPDCEKYLTKANEFAKKYEELKKYTSNTKNSSFSQILLTLSNDYANFKNKCNDAGCFNSASFPTIEKAQSSEVTSSSSIISKSIPVLSMFGAIAFFLGISYKYSLFGFRKRFQKQKLREKIKNIKKRMNH